MTVAKVTGGTIAVGGTTGAVGYGTYRYLTYETLRNLIEKEQTTGGNLVLLKESDNKDIWNKAADNYLVSLTESGGSSFTNKLNDSITAITAADEEAVLNKKRSDFKEWCLKFLDSKVTEESENNKDKVKAWCIKFESYGDKLGKKLDLDNSNWTTQYNSLITADQDNNALKGLLEAKKTNSSGENDDAKKTEAAKWWCKLLINKKSDSSSNFQNKCLLKTNN